MTLLRQCGSGTLLLAVLLLVRAGESSTNTSTCEAGVWDCRYDDRDDDVCADNNGDWKDPDDLLAAVLFAGGVMCLMAFNIGANDVANAWATSVGSGAISLTKATIIAGLADWAGALALGAGVSDKVSKGVSDIEDQECWACGYCDSQMSVYTIGMVGALVGASIFLLLATFTAMPVSTTHAIVGGIVGMTIAGVGADCVHWGIDGVGGIALSWVLSPALSGVIGAGAFLLTKALILDADAALDRARLFMPFLYAAVTWIMIFMIMIKSQTTKGLDMWIQVTVASVCGIVATVGGAWFVCKYLKDVRTQRTNSCEMSSSLNPVLMPKSSDLSVESSKHTDSESSEHSGDFKPSIQETYPNLTEDQSDAIFLFRFLLVFNAALESFSHGANDTANSTAAFTATWSAYANGLDSCDQKSTPTWIMGIGGGFVLLGIYTLGYRVIETVGKKLTTIDFHSAWCIEFASTSTVVIATLLEMPVSTTHCQIGAVTAVGCAAMGASKVNWWELSRIVLSWLLTLPFAGLLAAIILLMFRPAVCASCPWNENPDG